MSAKEPSAETDSQLTSHINLHYPLTPERKMIEEACDRFGLSLQTLLSEACLTDGIPLKDIMNELERKILIKALALAKGNQKEAAASLGMKYTTLNEKLKRHKIDTRRLKG